MRFNLLLVLILLTSCSHQEAYRNIALLGHAGNGLDAPYNVYHDNSREAVEYALQLEGSNGVEVDVQLSKDSELWLYHDPELDSETNGSGCISDQDSEALSKISYKGINAPRLARLKEVSAALLAGKTILLDLRHLNQCSGTFVDVDKLIEAIIDWRKSLAGNTEVITLTNYADWIIALKNAGLQVYYATETFGDARTICEQYQPEGIIMKNAAITADEVEEMQQKSKKVVIFEVRSPKQIRKAMKKAPDYVCTDNLTAAITEKYK